jgi:2-(1,2-epoxy-1,2-dihydrophenyl)acetyl-CoA isomerase
MHCLQLDLRSPKRNIGWGFKPMDSATENEHGESLIVTQNDALTTITINRPHRGNAMDADTSIALIGVIKDLQSSGECRSILLRSEGKHFCTGADISSSKRDTKAPRPTAGHMLRSLAAGPHKLIETLWNCSLPIVAEVKGRTSGMGLHMALACDYTVCAESASFAEPFVERGFSVDSGGSWLVPRYIGIARAKSLLYRAQPIDAVTAGEWGLVTEVVADDQLTSRSEAIARELGSGATFAIGVTKSLVHRSMYTSLEDALVNESYGVEITIRSDDFKEGMSAFMGKRKPNFEGH